MSAVQGRSVLVTGAGGFIGGHVTAALVHAGAQVRGFVRYNSRNDRGTLAWFDEEIAGQVEVVLGDLRDVESVARAVEGCELVLHLGAQIAIPYSYINPARFLRDQRARLAQRRTGGACQWRRAPGSHFDQRGLRHRAVDPDHRGSSARGTVSVCSEQDRRGQAHGQLPPHLRLARDGGTALQHLRTSPVGPGDHPDDHFAGSCVRHAASRIARSSTRPHFRRPTPQPG